MNMTILRSLVALAVFGDLVLVATSLLSKPCGPEFAFEGLILLVLMTAAVPLVLSAGVAITVACMLPRWAIRPVLLTPLPALAILAVISQLPHAPIGSVGCRFDL
ncbi:MAG TPA: hypothetical protein VGN14_11010 [Candidatus Elarobacter sp.]|jgi:hypothetical protein